MTLEDGEQAHQQRLDNSPALDVGEALSRVLGKANEEGRLTRGIYECATLLGKDPESVFLCLLSDNSLGDIALHMHFTLMEAYCWENNIKLIKVKGYGELVKLLSSNIEKVDNCVLQPEPATTADFCCLLVQYSHSADKDVDMETVVEHYKVMSEVTPYPMVTLGK